MRSYRRPVSEKKTNFVEQLSHADAVELTTDLKPEVDVRWTQRYSLTQR